MKKHQVVKVYKGEDAYNFLEYGHEARRLIDDGYTIVTLSVSNDRRSVFLLAEYADSLEGPNDTMSPR